MSNGDPMVAALVDLQQKLLTINKAAVKHDVDDLLLLWRNAQLFPTEEETFTNKGIKQALELKKKNYRNLKATEAHKIPINFFRREILKPLLYQHATIGGEASFAKKNFRPTWNSSGHQTSSKSVPLTAF